MGGPTYKYVAVPLKKFFMKRCCSWTTVFRLFECCSSLSCIRFPSFVRVLPSRGLGVVSCQRQGENQNAFGKLESQCGWISFHYPLTDFPVRLAVMRLHSVSLRMPAKGSFRRKSCARF